MSAATAAVLDGAAEREIAGVWRFSRESVRRAFDQGKTGDGLVHVVDQGAEPVDTRGLAEALHADRGSVGARVERSVDRLLGREEGGGYTRLSDGRLRLLAEAPSGGRPC